MGVGCTGEISVPSAQFCFEPETEVKGKFSQSCQTLCNPMDCSLPGSLSMEFSKKEYWRKQPFHSRGDLPNPGIKLRSPALQADSLPSEPPGEALVFLNPYFIFFLFPVLCFILSNFLRSVFQVLNQLCLIFYIKPTYLV